MKKYIIINFLFAFILILVGCDINKQNENDEMSQKQDNSNFERPEKNPNISGIVKTIIGNEITILKIEKPEISNSNEDADSEKDESEKEEKLGSGGRMGMGGGMGSRVNTDEESDERIERLKSMSTGEEKVIIPIGIKMLKSNDGEAIAATLSDITKDQMLMIWIDESIADKNIATFVMIK